MSQCFNILKFPHCCKLSKFFLSEIAQSLQFTGGAPIPFNILKFPIAASCLYFFYQKLPTPCNSQVALQYPWDENYLQNYMCVPGWRENEVVTMGNADVCVCVPHVRAWAGGMVQGANSYSDSAPGQLIEMCHP